MYEAIKVPTCSSDINSKLEKVMISWKAFLLCCGMVKAIQTWEMPSDLAEAKHFAVAVYNIAVVGGFTYFLSSLGNTDIQTFVALRCIGIFISATLSVFVIMLPKLLLVQVQYFVDIDWGLASTTAEQNNNHGSPGSVVPTGSGGVPATSNHRTSKGQKGPGSNHPQANMHSNNNHSVQTRQVKLDPIAELERPAVDSGTEDYMNIEANLKVSTAPSAKL
jgi:hypothetical protein